MNACSTLVEFFALVSMNGIPISSAKALNGVKKKIVINLIRLFKDLNAKKLASFLYLESSASKQVLLIIKMGEMDKLSRECSICNYGVAQIGKRIISTEN